MFTGPVIWRGLVYASLMIFAKLITGIWVLPASSLYKPFSALGRRLQAVGRKARSISIGHRGRRSRSRSRSPQHRPRPQHIELSRTGEQISGYNAPREAPGIYPGLILGSAMVARGEVGFLIASLAQGNGIFSSADSSGTDVFLVVIWAISICTLVGPVATGLWIGRVRKLNGRSSGDAQAESDALR